MILNHDYFIKPLICYFYDYRGPQFRTAFSELHTLLAFTDCPIIALSATMTVEMWKTLPKMLCMQDPVTVSETPDKPNMFFDRVQKPPNIDIVDCAESIYVPQLKDLVSLGKDYPVTLCYMPLEWCSDAQSFAVSLLGEPCLTNTPYAILFSTQDHCIVSHVLQQLKLDSPTLRLIFCSSSVGMGFDSPCISRVIHAKPPRNMIDFIQQVGRAGRVGQKALSLLYFNASDISINIEGMSDNMRKYCTTEACLRLTMLSVFGYEERAQEMTGCECCCNCKLNCVCSLCNKK